jgi:hypothetical protein
MIILQILKQRGESHTNYKSCNSSLNSVFHRILDYNRGGFSSGPFFLFLFCKIIKRMQRFNVKVGLCYKGGEINLIKGESHKNIKTAKAV